MAELNNTLRDIVHPTGDALEQADEWLAAFLAYLETAADPARDPRVRASAWARMAGLVTLHPQLAIGATDFGRFYCVRALELDPLCPLAHLQIVGWFGFEPATSEEVALFRQAVHVLRSYDVQMSYGIWGDAWREQVERRAKQYHEVLES